MKEIIREKDRKDKDDLVDGVTAGYCWWTVFVEELKAKNRKTMYELEEVA